MEIEPYFSYYNRKESTTSMKNKIISAIISGGLFAALIVTLGRYDVAQIGPDGTSVGYSSINQKVHELTGVHYAWYDLTDVLGYFAICICALFGLVGLIQLIRRRSLLRVDKTIYALGCFYIIVIGCYAFFEKFIVNYRPVIMPGDSAPEASFPSSHTMLIITVMASTAIVAGLYIHLSFLRTLVRFFCGLIIGVTVFGRLYCGVHWFSDIIGGILLSLTLVSLFAAAYSKTSEADKKYYGIDDGDEGGENVVFQVHVHGEPELKPAPAKASIPASASESRSVKPAPKAKALEPSVASRESVSGESVEDLYANYEGRREKKDNSDSGSRSGDYVPKH